MAYNKFLNPMTEEQYRKEQNIQALQRHFVESGRTAPFERGVARIALTEGCNFYCKFCHNEGMSGITKQFDLKQLDTILGAYKDKIKSIKLVGGEPLLHRQFDKVVEICQKVAPTSVTTNGSMLQKWMQSLVKLEGVTVSVHSLMNERYQDIMGTSSNVEEVVAGISELIAAGVNVHINCVLTRENQDEAERIIERFAQIGVSEIKFLEILKVKEEDGDLYFPLAELTERLKKKYGEPKVAGSTKMAFPVNEKTSALLVYQYCSVGCNVCRVEGFLRIDPEPALSYCLAAEPVSIGEEASKGDVEGLKAKFELAMNGMGKPTGYTYSVKGRKRPNLVQIRQFQADNKAQEVQAGL